MRQFAVNDRAIPPDLNDTINRCHACDRAFKATGNPISVCGDHAAALSRYAREIGAPSPLGRGGVRLHYTAHITEDAREYDLSRLHDKQQQRIQRSD